MAACTFEARDGDRLILEPCRILETAVIISSISSSTSYLSLQVFLQVALRSTVSHKFDLRL